MLLLAGLTSPAHYLAWLNGSEIPSQLGLVATTWQRTGKYVIVVKQYYIQTTRGGSTIYHDYFTQ